MIYREEGWVAEVKVISKEPKKSGETEGEEITLSVIKTLRESHLINKEALPQDGTTFSVWAAKGARVYCGWSLSDY